MSRLVVLSEGLTGRTYELKVDKTTIGRVEDNAFQIADASVSGHHCEVLLRGNDVVVKDLGSTNGTFINGQQVTGEGVVKSGQILRLGTIEMRLESGDAKAASGKKVPDQTMVIPQGVKFNETQGTKTVNPFPKKSNKGTKVFIAIAVIVFLAIVVIVFLAIAGTKSLSGEGTASPPNAPAQ